VLNLTGWKKVILGVIATIILGAIGSGVWDLVGKDVSQWLGRLILSAATLGSSAVVNSVYREAAKGFHEATALEQFSLVTIVVFSGVGGVLAFFSGKSKGRREAKKEVREFEDALGDLSPNEKMVRIKSRIDKLDRKLDRSLLQLRLLTICFVVLLASSTAFDYIKLSQANSTATFFRQSVAICAPYMSEHDRLSLESQFASMRSKAEFLGILEHLRGIAGANHRQLPDFTPL
jgi:hypothetical protein